MAYGDVKQNFPKGTLNSYWYYIELCRLLFPDEDGTQIDKLQEALIRYSLISPWPLPDGDDPELFIVRFFANEHEDFYYYLGLGQGLELGLHLDKQNDAEFDLEGAIAANCLKRAPKKDIPALSKDELHKKTLAERSDVIDYLEAMGDVDKRSIIQETGASAALIDSVLKTLKENELLRVNKRGQVVKFDGAAARKLLLEAK